MREFSSIRSVICLTFFVSIFAASVFAQQIWTTNTAYAVGALVVYNDATYRCLQAHTSIVSWEPPNAPSLWQLQGGGNPNGTPAIPGQAFPSRFFAPYVDTLLYPTFPLADTAAATGVKYYTLAFITAGNGCDARWGGVIGMNEDFLISDLNALRTAGGNVVVSFGGANGIELAQACTSISSLQAQYQAVINRYNLTHVDFDIEGGALGDAAANDRRNKAIAALQTNAAANNRRLVVSYTLPVLPDGLTFHGTNILQNAVANNVNVSVVNIMAMDYGAVANPNTMGQNAIDAANSTLAQIAPIFPNRTNAERKAMIGITPMIGLNDVVPEVFTFSDAQLLLNYARTNEIGRLAMWSMTRDKQCNGSPQVSPVCSGIAQTQFAFANLFKSFTTAAPASVGISGRITSAQGRSVSNALIKLTNTATNETRTIISSPFGYYRFVGVLTGQTYSVEIHSKRYNFAAQTIVLSGQMSNLNFTAQ